MYRLEDNGDGFTLFSGQTELARFPRSFEPVASTVRIIEALDREQGQTFLRGVQMTWQYFIRDAVLTVCDRNRGLRREAG